MRTLVMSATLLPFLYQTQTLRSVHRILGAQRGAWLSRLLPIHREPSRVYSTRRTDPIPFEIPPDLEITDKEELGETTRPDENGRKSTITPIERDTFNRIFDEIAARGERAQPPAHSRGTTGTIPGSHYRDSRPSFDPRPFTTAIPHETNASRGQETVNIIIQDAVRELEDSRMTSQTQPALLQPLGKAVSVNERSEALMQFPPSLRRAARLALGVVDPSHDNRLREHASKAAYDEESDSLVEEELPAVRSLLPNRPDHDPSAQRAKLDGRRQEEQNRIQKMMQAANTDLELWEVLEREVFTMVAELGIGQDKSKRNLGKTDKKRRPRGKRPAGLSMSVHGPLYPSFLLLGLRMLDQAFEAPSLLSLSVLPRIKQLGLASYVLGVSTPLYNTLAAIQWHRYNDITAVFNLLEEMRHAGLSFDHETRDVVGSVERCLEEYNTGGSGGMHATTFLPELMKMPEFEAAMQSRIRQWQQAISVSIYERQKDIS